jgi:hypothetical protein
MNSPQFPAFLAEFDAAELERDESTFVALHGICPACTGYYWSTRGRIWGALP